MPILDLIYNELHEKIRAQSLRIIRCTQYMARHALPSLTAEYGFDNADRLMDAIADGCKYRDIGMIMQPSFAVIENFENMEMIRFIDRLHPLNSFEIIERTSADTFESKEYKRVVTDICLYHHERFDGRGYPGGLAGTAVPLVAELCGMAGDIDLRIFGTGTRESRFQTLCDYYKSGVHRSSSGAAVDCFFAARENIWSYYAEMPIRIVRLERGINYGPAEYVNS